MPTRQPRSEKLDIRLAPRAKRILQEAARERHTTISQFVLDSAMTAATEVLAERSRIGLNSADRRNVRGRALPSRAFKEVLASST